MGSDTFRLNSGEFQKRRLGELWMRQYKGDNGYDFFRINKKHESSDSRNVTCSNQDPKSPVYWVGFFVF